MKSFEIEANLKDLTSTFKKTYQEEVKAFITESKAAEEKAGTSKEAIEQKIRYELTSIAASNGSTWSGGNSVSNMIEQIKRETALEMLRNLSLIG